jgi:GntR family transcriptional regulator, rspAB operon transcriptional repressor
MNQPFAKSAGDIASRKKKSAATATVSLTEEAYRLLKWKILSMELAPGTSINEQGLVDATGFGRAPIHQALHQLQYDGLIEIRPRKGAQVRVWSPRDFEHLMEARIPLESAMARLAALRAKESDIHDLQQRLDEGAAMIEASDRENLMLLDHHFHSALAAFAQSPVLAEMVENLHHRSALLWYIPISGRKEYEVVLRQHQEILDAVAARDPDTAAAAMAAHISGLAHTTNL